MKQIADIMTKKVVTVEMDDKLSLIEILLEDRRFKHLPVVDEEKQLMGIVSDRDLRAALTPFLHTPAETKRDTALLHRHVHQIMTRKPVTVTPEDAIDYGARLLLINEIPSLPVINAQNRVVGIVSWEDILCFYTRQSID
jgi:acetoin utilization protein AcuB